MGSREYTDEEDRLLIYLYFYTTIKGEDIREVLIRSHEQISFPYGGTSGQTRRERAFNRRYNALTMHISAERSKDDTLIAKHYTTHIARTADARLISALINMNKQNPGIGRDFRRMTEILHRDGLSESHWRERDIERVYWSLRKSGKIGDVEPSEPLSWPPFWYLTITEAWLVSGGRDNRRVPLSDLATKMKSLLGLRDVDFSQDDMERAMPFAIKYGFLRKEGVTNEMIRRDDEADFGDLRGPMMNPKNPALFHDPNAGLEAAAILVGIAGTSSTAAATSSRAVAPSSRASGSSSRAAGTSSGGNYLRLHDLLNHDPVQAITQNIGGVSLYATATPTTQSMPEPSLTVTAPAAAMTGAQRRLLEHPVELAFGGRGQTPPDTAPSALGKRVASDSPRSTLEPPASTEKAEAKKSGTKKRRPAKK
ncbi:hypothetical protein MMC13_006756 [Lambiella insularis]|nr:hypothetical protein [Lambiella insularis]